ncbi:energy transducer TonB [Sphingomonas aliaeris]|uniref:Energy transducer TonB n=1 Tax=Sphingomonas aliaeris TaxID=2759526 RepID=A0A974NWR1_9SPHN|nr:energy transducer TonB [Sphingomonas aliaeris]QQV78290.1 energy transducer TonB [Sphingomonas aliaeris]
MATPNESSKDVAWKPSGPWFVEYADNMCVLNRNYGTGRERLLLGFRPSPMGERMEVVTITSEARGVTMRGTGKVDILPDGRSVPSDFVSWRPKDRPDTRVTMFELSEKDINDVLSAGQFKMSGAGLKTVQVALKGTTAARDALRKCSDDLLQSWKIDPAERSLMAQRPLALGMASWVRDNDYPIAALKAGAQGTTSIIWRVGIDGRVTDCRVVRSSGHALLDETACKLAVKYSRYKPAVGKDGKPMAAHVSLNFTWML